MNKFQVALLSTLLVANFNFLNAYAYELVGDEDEAGNSATLVTPMANSIKLAILAKDANALAKFMSYPIDLKVKDQEVHFDSKEDFINAKISFNDLFSEKQQKELEESAKDTSCCEFVGWRGAMLANGIIWFDDAGITGMNNDPGVKLKPIQFCKEDEYNAEIQLYGNYYFSIVSGKQTEATLTNDDDEMSIKVSGEKDAIPELKIAGKKTKLTKAKDSTQRLAIYNSGNLQIALLPEGDIDQSTGSDGNMYGEKIVMFTKDSITNECKRSVFRKSSY